MKTIFKTFIYLIFFIFALLYFAPKELGYNLLEKELAKKSVIISDEIRQESLFGLELNQANIYFEKINIAKLNELNINTYLFSTSLNVQEIVLLDSLKSMFPSKIDTININHSILEFDKINISSKGDFGSIVGQADLINRVLKLNLTPSKLMRSKYSSFLRRFRNTKEGFIYEYRF